MNDSFVSIITPSYNCTTFISETISSVIKQTYTNWELIIVDDASTDNSVSRIKNYQKEDKRIRLIELETNQGAAIARTIGISQATGEYIAFLDSDDLWMPDKLEKQLHFMEANSYNFSCTKYAEVNEAGKATGTVIKVKPKANYSDTLKSCPIGNSTVMYNQKVLGKFEVPDIKRNNDFALWLQILKKETFIYGLPEVLTKYRVRNDSISSNKVKMLKYHWLLFRKHEGLSFFKSAGLIIGWVLIKLLDLKKEK